MRTNILIWISGFVLGMTLIIAISTGADNQEKPSLSFNKKPYVNPKMIRDMTTLLSDTGDQVIAVDPVGSQDSNRYSCRPEARTADGQSPFIYYMDGEEMFGYRYIGKTSSDIDVLHTISSGFGSGVFHDLLFVKIENDKHLSFDRDKSIADFTRDRQVLKKLGSISLGDGFEGTIELHGDSLSIHGTKKETTRGPFEEPIKIIH